MENAKSLAEHIREKYNISTDEIERLFKVQLDAEKVRLIKYIEDNAARSNTEFTVFFYDLDKADYYTEMKMRRRSDSVFHPKFKKRLNEFLRDEGFRIQTLAEHTSINLLYLGSK